MPNRENKERRHGFNIVLKLFKCLYEIISRRKRGVLARGADGVRMVKRIITGIIAGGIAFAAIWFGGIWFGLALGFIVTVGLFEFIRALKTAGHRPMITPAVLLWLTYPLMLFSTEKIPGTIKLAPTGDFNWFTLLVLLAVMAVMAIFVFGNKRFKLDDGAFPLLGGLYVPFLLTFAYCLREMEHGGHYVMIALDGAVSADTAAFAIGSLMGKHKLCPEISPNKTVEGFVAGFLGSVAGLCFYGGMLPLMNIHIGIPFWFYPVMGIVLGAVSQLGDLFASAVKRYCGIKDFGKILPGHGGVLDRVDSYIPALVVTYVLISAFFA